MELDEQLTKTKEKLLTISRKPYLCKTLFDLLEEGTIRPGKPFGIKTGVRMDFIPHDQKKRRIKLLGLIYKQTMFLIVLMKPDRSRQRIITRQRLRDRVQGRRYRAGKPIEAIDLPQWQPVLITRGRPKYSDWLPVIEESVKDLLKALFFYHDRYFPRFLNRVVNLVFQIAKPID